MMKNITQNVPEWNIVACGVFRKRIQLELKKKSVENNYFWIGLSLSNQVSNIKAENSQNGNLEDYNNISDGIIPHFTTPL